MATRTAGTPTCRGGPARPSGPCCTPSRYPPVGGDTLFADMYAAYDGLEPELQDRIDGLPAVHDYSKVFGHTVKAEGQREAMRAKYPPVEHPVVRDPPRHRTPEAALCQPVLRRPHRRTGPRRQQRR